MLDRFPDSPHKVKIKVQIMIGIQLRRQNFTRPIQVPQVGTRIIFADLAAASRIEWSRIIFIHFGLYVDPPLTCKSMPLRAFLVGMTQSNIS